MNQGAVGGLKTSSWVPPGVVWEYVGITPPDGWLFCDGSAVSRAQYPDLFVVIGIQHGAGNGNSTFNLPDHRGKAGVGLDVGQTEFNVLGLTGGFKNKTASHSHDMGNHTHSRTAASVTGSTGAVNGVGTAQYVWDYTSRGGQSANHAHGMVTTTLNGNSGDGWQGYAWNDNHQGAQTTDRTGELVWSGCVNGRNTVHAHGLISHEHGLEAHYHLAGNHTHSDTFANPSPNVSGESSQVDPGQPNAGNLQPYAVTNFIVKY